VSHHETLCNTFVAKSIVEKVEATGLTGPILDTPTLIPEPTPMFEIILTKVIADAFGLFLVLCIWAYFKQRGDEPRRQPRNRRR